jgi:hypothetical protein
MKRFSEAKALTRALIAERPFALFLLFAITTLLTYQVNEAMLELGPREENTRLVMQISLGLMDLVEGIVLFLILSHALPDVRHLKLPLFEPKPFKEPYLNSFMAEYLRLLGQTLLWALLLILPGLYRYCRLAFVPYIALFAKKYRNGEVDAAQLSLQLTAPRQPEMLLIILASGLSSGLIEYLPQMDPALQIFGLRIACSTAAFLIMVFSYSYLFVVFEESLQEHKWT